MSLRLRLAAALVAVIVATVAAVWFVTIRPVLQPFETEAFEAFVAQAVFVADRVEEGDEPDELSERLDLVVHYVHRPPPGPRIRIRSRMLVIPPHGPRDKVFVRTWNGWIFVGRKLDVDRPRRQLALLLPLLTLGIVLVAGGIAAVSTRPLRAAQDAMDRVAEGQLEHRLDESGPAELASLAIAFNGMADRVQELLQVQQELMAGVSHELRTPLTRLRLETELLRELGPNAARLDAIDAELAELDALIGELLTVSRLQLGDRTLDAEPVDLAAVGAELAPTTGEGTVSGDLTLIRRALRNLVDNARKHGGDDVTVRIEVEGSVVRVIDDGVGVPAEMLPRLFDPFFRTGTSTAAGTGLGLMIVRQVAELHGGTVVAEDARPGLIVTLAFASAAR